MIKKYDYVTINNRLCKICGGYSIPLLWEVTVSNGLVLEKCPICKLTKITKPITGI